MTKKPSKKSAPKKTIPSYLKEAFNMVQPGKSNHVSTKAGMGGKRAR